MSQAAPSNYAAAPALGYAATAPVGYNGVAAAPVGYAAAAPTLGYAAGPAGYAFAEAAPVAAAPVGYAVAEAAPVAAVGYAAPVAAVQETIHAGPAVAQTEVHHGVVGTRTVQVQFWINRGQKKRPFATSFFTFLKTVKTVAPIKNADDWIRTADLRYCLSIDMGL